MADWLLEQEDWNDGYDGYEREDFDTIKPSFGCRYCGAGGLYWGNAGNDKSPKWRLGTETMGVWKIHTCKEYFQHKEL